MLSILIISIVFVLRFNDGLIIVVHTYLFQQLKEFLIKRTASFMISQSFSFKRVFDLSQYGRVV